MRKTVSSSFSFSPSISSSKLAAPIGSSPAVGSSRNSSSGSSASARARPARLLMPPDSSDGIFRPGVGGQAGHGDLVAGDLVEQRLLDEREIFADRHLDILGDGQGREERAVLEQHSPAPADILRLVLLAPDHIFAEHLDVAGVRHLKADDRAHQHRLAGARSADDAENLAAADIEVEAVMDDLVAEAVLEPADRDDRSPSLIATRSS